MADWRDWELDEIPEWSTRAHLVLLVAGAIMLFIVMSYLWLLPLKSDIRHAHSEEESLKNQFKLKVQQVAKVSGSDKQIKWMENVYQQNVKQFPNENELVELLASINAIGSKNHLLFQRIDWQKGKQFKHFYQLPLKLEVEGNYQNFGSFSEALASLPHIVILQEVNVELMKPNKKIEPIEDNALDDTKGTRLRFSMIAYTYHYSSDDR